MLILNYSVNGTMGVWYKKELVSNTETGVPDRQLFLKSILQMVKFGVQRGKKQEQKLNIMEVPGGNQAECRGFSQKNKMKELLEE